MYTLLEGGRSCCDDCFCLEFYRHCKIDKSLNDTFIALIPKKSNAVDIKIFILLV